jgi:hypothetical protein
MDQTLENSVYYVSGREYLDHTTFRNKHMYILTDYNLRVHLDGNGYHTTTPGFMWFLCSKNYEIKTVLEYLPQIVTMLDIIKNSAKKFDYNNNNKFTIDDLCIKYNIINLSYYTNARDEPRYINNIDELYDFIFENKQYFPYFVNDIKIALKD